MPITEMNLNNEVEETEKISSLFDPIYVPSEVSPNRKYDGGRSPENMTRDFMVRNDKIIEKPTKTNDNRNLYNNDGEMLVDFKVRKSDLDQKDSVRDAFDKEPALPVSEALWEDEDGGDIEPEWSKYLKIHGHTSEEGNVFGEKLSEPLNKKDIDETNRIKYFGHSR